DCATPDDRLPPRLFVTNRYPICRLNVYSKPDTLTVVRNLLRDVPELDQILDSSFGGLFSLPANRAPISCKLIQALIARQLVTKHKYEMWTVFGGQPLCFSLNEFQSITGVNCSLFEEGYETPSTEATLKEPDLYWKRWIGDDVKTTCADIATWLRGNKDMPTGRRLRLALLLIVDCVLIANHQTHTPTPRYVRMVDDLDNFLKFPWGRESFIKTLWLLRPPRASLIKSKDDPVALFCKQLQQKSIKLNGFPLVLQLTPFRAIPALLAKLPDPSDVPRIIDFSSEGFHNNAAVMLNDVRDAEIDCNLVVNPLIDLPPIYDDGSSEWDDEVRDRKVEFMLKLIKQDHIFLKEQWPGGDDSCPLLVHEPFNSKGSHKKHIINRRKGKSTTKPVVCGISTLPVSTSKPKGSSAFVKYFMSTMPNSPDEKLPWLANQVAQLAFKLNTVQPDTEGTSKRPRSVQKNMPPKGESAKHRQTTKPQSSPTASSEEASIWLNEDHVLVSPKIPYATDHHTHVHQVPSTLINIFLLIIHNLFHSCQQGSTSLLDEADVDSLVRIFPF
ncbi:hypothetical protein EUTSA_v10012388mg, partial [Eutrema salsugineum]